MKVQKERIRVTIVCNDQSLVIGYIHLVAGQRVLDFLNHVNETFIPVTEAETHNVASVHSFKLYNELLKKKRLMLLNKNSIKWVEEI